MNSKNWTGYILIFIAISLFFVGLKDQEAENYNQHMIRQAQIAKNQSLTYTYTLKSIILGSTPLFIASGIFLIPGLIILYRLFRSEEYEAY